MSKIIEMKEITGTEKQVAWANDIRATKVAKLKELSQKLSADRAATFEKSISLCALITNAKWWIDHREPAGLDFIKELSSVEKFAPVTDQVMQAWNDQQNEDNPTVIKFRVCPAAGGSYSGEQTLFKTKEEAEEKADELKIFGESVIKEEACRV